MTVTPRLLAGTALVDGAARGPVRAARDMLSFWGGFDPATGVVIDRRHSLSGVHLGGSVVVLGSPHFMPAEFAELAELVRGRTRHPGVDVLITTNRMVYEQAVDLGWAQPIEAFGARIATDTCLCMLSSAMLAPTVRTVMTDSGKFAHYGPGLVGRTVLFRGIGDCVESAVVGQTQTTAPPRGCVVERRQEW